MSRKLKQKSALALVLALSAAVICSCGTKEDLFDSYNSCFVAVGRDNASFVLTAGTQGEMLRDVYEISLADVPATTLALSCPAACDFYEWKITALDGTAALSDTQNGTYKGSGQHFSVYIAKSEDCIFYSDAKQSGKPCSYRIHLSVKVGNQDFYDSAVLIVHAAVGEEKEE